MTQENKESSFRLQPRLSAVEKRKKEAAKRGALISCAKQDTLKGLLLPLLQRCKSLSASVHNEKRKRGKGNQNKVQQATSAIHHCSLSLFLARKAHLDFPPKRAHFFSPVTKSLSFLSRFYIAGAVLPSRVIGFETGKSFGRSTGTGETLILQCLASSIGIGQHCLDSQTHVAFP